LSGPYNSLTPEGTRTDGNRWRKGGEALTCGERRLSVGELRAMIMVGEL